jgi:hypothetical protein
MVAGSTVERLPDEERGWLPRGSRKVALKLHRMSRCSSRAPFL